MFSKRKIQAAQARSAAQGPRTQTRQIADFKNQFNLARKTATGANTTTNADMRGIGKLVRQPVPPGKRPLIGPIGGRPTGLPPGKMEGDDFRPLISKRPGERLPIGVTPGKRPIPKPMMPKPMMKKGGAVKKAKPRGKK